MKKGVNVKSNNKSNNNKPKCLKKLLPLLNTKLQKKVININDIKSGYELIKTIVQILWQSSEFYKKIIKNIIYLYCDENNTNEIKGGANINIFKTIFVGTFFVGAAASALNIPNPAFSFLQRQDPSISIPIPSIPQRLDIPLRHVEEKITELSIEILERLQPLGDNIESVTTILETIHSRTGETFEELLSNLEIPQFIKNIYVLGNLSDYSKIFLEKKFNKKIKHINLPFLGIDELYKLCPTNFEYNDLVIITLPTPKQEYLAFKIRENNKFYKIICIGGAVTMASGEEKPIPELMDNLGLEFLWRLRSETLRRSKRLMLTAGYFIISNILGKYYNLRIYVVEKK
jgi:hypothetical protein